MLSPFKMERRSEMPEPVKLDWIVNLLSVGLVELESNINEAVAVLEILKKESN